MLLYGYLSEYSLAEIFNLIQEGNKTGILSIEPAADSTEPAPNIESATLERSCYYVSFKGGRVMSIFYGLEYENQDLLTMIAERQWISIAQLPEYQQQLNGISIPWGLHLKFLDVISAERLRLLFDLQVIANIAKIFEIVTGKFRFDPNAHLNYPEMTGLSLAASEAVLLGLRELKNWSVLTAKLPEPEAGLQRVSAQLSGAILSDKERLVWQLAQGNLSIREISTQLNLDIETVRQIGFRLSAIGLMSEVTLKSLVPEIPKPVCVDDGNPSVRVSTGFVNTLIGFLEQQMG
jgi:hypothetical protein